MRNAIVSIRNVRRITQQLGYADYLGALQRYRIEYPRDFHILAVSDYLINYPFTNRLYPNSLDVVERCRPFGVAVIVSDGDVVFQPAQGGAVRTA